MRSPNSDMQGLMWDWGGIGQGRQAGFLQIERNKVEG